MTLTLGGNAAVLIRIGTVRVVTDPWLDDRIGPWRRLRPCGLAPADLQDLDALLISHAHPDHLSPRSLRTVPRSTPVLSPGGTPFRRLRALGFERAEALEAWQTWEAGPLRVTAVPSVHTRWSLGFVVEAEGRRVYFAGDAGPKTPFAEIGRRCGPVDAGLIPVGGSVLAPGPFQRHLTPELAARATAALRPRVAIPMHWGHVPCVPAVLDRFRGTAEQYVEAMRRHAPDIPVAVPEEGVPFDPEGAADSPRRHGDTE